MSARTLEECLSAAADRHPDGAAVVAESATLTYAELDRLADGVAAGLTQRRIRRGDRVALVLPNGIDAVVAIYGALRAGATIVPLSPAIKRERLEYVLSDVEPAAVFTDAGRTDLVRSAAGNHGSIAVLNDVGAMAADPGGMISNRPFEDDLAAIMYTSGSTGHPKGVMLTHHNMCFAAESIVQYLELSRSDRILCVLQLSFGYGLSQLLTCVAADATLVLGGSFAMPGRVVKALEQHEITGLPGVPTIFQVLISLRGLAERDLPHLRFLTNAGAALPAATVTALKETFPGVKIFSMYGLTECIRVSYLPPDQIERRPTSSGIPMPGTEAWVEDDRGDVLGPHQVGELMVSGGHVMQGYWRDPGATAERLRGGRWPWAPVLATGDLFRRDEDGYLFWVGRTDDLIKSRGEKVYPREIEEVLHAAEGVAEAVVVGVPDPLLGQAIHAHVAPIEGALLDERALRRRCAEKLEDHMIPKRVILHERIPRTPRGKVDRAALLDQPTTKLRASDTEEPIADEPS